MVQGTAAGKPIENVQPRPRHRPIDLVHLGKQALGDPGLESEILRLFDTMSRTYYERLETSTSVSQLLEHLHTLKGAAAGVGAFRIADLARATEEELRSGAPVNPERIHDLGMAVHECSAFIGELLEDEPA
jgi:HPt (histidine-containing phosphotransfer) domain-containing protein